MHQRKLSTQRLPTVIIAGCLLLAAGCVTTAGFEEMADSYLGESEDGLVARFGPPTSVYVSPEGARFLTYARSRVVTIPGQTPTYQTTIIGGTAYTNPIGGSSPLAVTQSCELTFVLVGGVVSDWRAEGNNCKA